MKKFNFEFEKVLEYRNFEKQQAENELSKALAVETQINENLKTIAEQYLHVKNTMKGNSDFNDVISQSQYNNLLDYQKEELLNQLAQAKIVSDEKRKVLIECIKKTTALEKLKDQKLSEYKEMAKSEEKKFLDDLATTRYKNNQ